jgi:putative transposase
MRPAGSYGSPRVWADLTEDGQTVSRKRVVRLMREEGLVTRARRRFKVTTMSDHDQPGWVSDTSEFLVGGGGKIFIAAVLDLFSLYVVGWAISAVNDRHLTIKALEMAVTRRRPQGGLLHHSDQGCTLGFKGSSQRVYVSSSLSDSEVPPLAFSNRVSFAVDC